MPTEAEASVPTEDWLIALYVAVDTWWQREGQHVLPGRPGPSPACSDAELVTLALAGVFLERRSERAWRAEVVANWAHLFPRVPAQSEWNRRVRWLWGAFEHLRAFWLRPLPVVPGGWHAIDTAPLPIKHPSRVRGVAPGAWAGPGNDLAPGFGFCAALSRWFYGFRLALRTGHDPPSSARCLGAVGVDTDYLGDAVVDVAHRQGAEDAVLYRRLHGRAQPRGAVGKRLIDQVRGAQARSPAPRRACRRSAPHPAAPHRGRRTRPRTRGGRTPWPGRHVPARPGPWRPSPRAPAHAPSGPSPAHAH